MSILRILAMVTLLTVGADLPAFAQAAIQEPGAYAFYHPDADVLNAGDRLFDRLTQCARSPARTPLCLALIIRNGGRFCDATAGDVV